MHYLSAKSKIEIVEKNSELDDFINLSEELFFINEILLIPEAEIEVKETIQKVNKGDLIKITQLIDIEYQDNLILVSCGHLFVSQFKKFITHLERDSTLGFDAKKKRTQEAIYKLAIFSKAHNVFNRFSFTSKSILQVKCLDGKVALDYSNVQLSEEQNNSLQESFLIRQEVFSELLNLTEAFLYKLDYNSYKFSEFKMDPEKGKYLLHEFIIGLGEKNDFINLNSTELQQLEKSLFQLFGLEPPQFGRMREKILKRANPAKYLESIISNVEKSSIQFQKLHNQNK